MSYGLKPTIRERVLHTHWKACVEAIRDRFPALSPRLAAIVLGYAVDGRLPPAWDTEEIARKIGIPPGNFSELMPEIHRIVEKAAEKPPVNLPSTKAGSSGHRRWALALALALVTLSLIGVVLADQNGAFQDGKSLGSSVNQSAFSGINSGAASDKIPGYGTNPSETQFFQGGQGQLSGPGVAKMQNCATATPDSDPIKRQECEAVNFLARNPQIRPQFNITKNDPMILAAKHARDNAEEFFKSLGINGGTGSGSQCTTRVETTPAQYSTETCSSFKEVNEQQCTMGRLVNIDTDSNFQCDQTINAYETLKCRRGTNVTCTGGGTGCAPSGIKMDSVSVSGFGTAIMIPAGGGYWDMTFGTITSSGDLIENYFKGRKYEIYESNINFTVVDKNSIAEMKLFYVEYDDHVVLWINGNLVYSTTGGYKLDKCTTEFGLPGIDDGVHGCSWGYWEGGGNKYSPISINLQPYLYDGNNNIKIRLAVGRNGETMFKLRTLAYCPVTCSVSTRNDCAALEERAR